MPLTGIGPFANSLIVNSQFLQTLGTRSLPAGFLECGFDVCLRKAEMKVVCALGHFSDY